MEHLHPDVQRLLGKADDVGIGAIREDNGVAFQDVFEGSESITPLRSLLILLALGRSGHRRSGFAHVAISVPVEKSLEIRDKSAIVLRRNAPHAGSAAPTDESEETGSARPLRATEHTISTGADREDLRDVLEGVPNCPGMCVGPEIVNALAFRLAHDRDAWPRLPDGDGKEGIGLIVSIPDVESWIELLDPRVLESQCLDLGCYRYPVHG